MLNEGILRLEDVALRSKCKAVDVEDPEELALVQGLIREMFRTMYADPGGGVALAAPQVGVLLQVVVIDYQDRDTSEQHLMALINPKIVRRADESDEAKEICLSVPNFSGKVARSTSVEVEAYDQHGQSISFTAEGFLARVVQHELDHLNGVLYIDRVDGELNKVPDFPERRIEPTLRKLKLSDKS
jgi:peptide deformylase